MDKSHSVERVEAVPAPAVGAERARAGAAQPPLDLSLGHIGTTDDDMGGDVVVYGRHTVILDYTALAAQVVVDTSVSSSRADRRSELRQVDKLIKTARKSGMSVTWRDAPLPTALELDHRSEDVQ